MRRGGIPYDQLVKTNMYADADKAGDHDGGNDPNGLSAAKKKKKGKKGKRKQQQAHEIMEFQGDDAMDQSHMSSHDENRRFFEDQM